MRAWIALLPLALACADAGPRVRVGTAADFGAPRSATVSVLGVFRDGRMSRDSWQPLSATVSKALGKEACAIGWGPAMREAEPDLAQWVDAQARENGVTEELLGRVAPHANGEYVMTLMVYRYMPRSRTRPTQAGARARASTPMAGRRGRYARGATRVVEEEEEHVFELSASLFSVPKKKLVAEIDLRYAGDDLDEAMNAFTAKLRALVPGASCVGWKWPEPADDSTDSSDATEASPTPSGSN